MIVFRALLYFFGIGFLSMLIFAAFVFAVMK